MFVYETTGTAYEGCMVTKKYQTKKNNLLQDASAMTGEEYMDAVKAAWQHFMQHNAFRRVAGNAMLVHDKARQHTCSAVHQWLQQQGVAEAVQPARSPDMMPMDYSVFGTARTLLDRAQPVRARWEDRVATFKQLLSSFEPRATIEEFPLRMKVCIESSGQQFGNELRDSRGGDRDSRIRGERPDSPRRHDLFRGCRHSALMSSLL